MKRHLLMCTVAFASVLELSCRHDPVRPPRAILEVRNLRADTIATLHMTDCTTPTINTTDYLPFREEILPGANWIFAPGVGCWDAEFVNARDSVLAARNHIVLNDGDSLVVVLTEK